MIDVDQFSNLDGLRAAFRRAAAYLRPPPDMLPSEFAERNIVIPLGNAAPGPIRFDAVPYQRQMIDVIVEPGVKRVSYMLPAQVGKTTLMQAISAYFVAHEPRSQIWLMPSEGDMQTFRATKLEPMLQANPAIANRMSKPRAREGKNNSRMISFIGGWMMFSWAGSPKTLRGRSAPVTIADEIDGMDNAGSAERDEGDPVQLLMQRAASFSAAGQALHIESSTPTVRGHSRIETAFDSGDQRRLFVPCPHCGVDQVMRWENVLWAGRQDSVEADAVFTDHQPETAAYACEACGALWSDGDRCAAIRRSEFRPTRPSRGHASFHMTEMCSPFRRLRDIVQSYLDKIAVGSWNTFANVSLAQTFEESAERADPTALESRAEDFAAEVPAGGVYLTAGVDMQGDRLEAEIVAWGEGEESWSVDYRVLWGDPLAGEVWEDLDALLATTFTHETGAPMRIEAACVDTGGTTGYTQAAYDYLRGKTGRRLFGIKGVGGWGRAVVEKVMRKQSGKNARKIDLFLIGVDEAKLIVQRRLAIEHPGPGYCHIPKRDDLAEWCQQVTAEKLVTRYVKGQPRREWTKPDRARNEAGDCRVYAFAALKIMKPPLRRLRERMEAHPRAAARREAAADPPKPVTARQADPAPEPAERTKPRQRMTRGGGGRGWVNRW